MAGAGRRHTVAVTEREALAAAARGAGLRLGAGDLDALLNAWRRYRELMAELSAALADEAPAG
jgi:hypothetical protein